MYGYIRPQSFELKVREDIFYRSIYCGLCRSLSKHTGGFSSITLSYDMTFFAIMRMILKREKYDLKKRGCILHPFTKHPIMKDNPELKYTAYVSSVLAHEKIRDNIHDEKFFKKMLSYLIYPFTAAFRNRNKIKFINETAKKYLDKLALLEKEKCPRPDEPAECFGALLGTLLSYDLSESEARIAYNIGMHLGRYVYIGDAICDYEQDLKDGKYNPFIYSFQSNDERDEFLKEGYKLILNREQNEILTSLNLICESEVEELSSCAYNIVKLGMSYNFQLKYKKSKGEKENGDKSI